MLLITTQGSSWQKTMRRWLQGGEPWGEERRQQGQAVDVGMWEYGAQVLSRLTAKINEGLKGSYLFTPEICSATMRKKTQLLKQNWVPFSMS